MDGHGRQQRSSATWADAASYTVDASEGRKSYTT
jgi:hypothetical protein